MLPAGTSETCRWVIAQTKASPGYPVSPVVIWYTGSVRQVTGKPSTARCSFVMQMLQQRMLMTAAHAS